MKWLWKNTLLATKETVLIAFGLLCMMYYIGGGKLIMHFYLMRLMTEENIPMPISFAICIYMIMDIFPCRNHARHATLLARQ